MKTRHHAERGQLGLALAGQNVDLGPADPFGLGDEGFAVLGVAAGGRRDRPELGHLETIAQGAKAPQRRQRLLDRIGGEEPGGLDLAAEAGEHFLIEDRRGAAGEALIGHQPHRVRSDVDNRNRRPGVEATLGGLHGQTPC